jgi:serine/threonine protein kinase/soluble lytic murein transglycosylase-like protein
MLNDQDKDSFAIAADCEKTKSAIGIWQSEMLPMTPERWQKVEEVLQAALDRPQPERASFLNEACSGDDQLQREASSLIDAYDEAGDFIEQPAIAQDAHVLISSHELSNLGREIGPYKIVERLGGGGMGEVYLAQDARLDRLVALKVLPAYFVSDDSRLSRFQREARAASALNHPNILTIHEVGELEGVHFIATEFIDGQTIRELIARDQLSLTDVVDIGIQVASALAAAHAAGIVHRDIKPENIMRRSDGIVKILDFGIAKLLEQVPAESSAITRAETETGVLLGTVGYMSPEQARGLAVDERTDIWSLGVVLYEMLACRVPFNGATRMDTMVAILEREPAPLFSSTADPPWRRLQTIVGRALRKERAERYQTAAELLADLTGMKSEVDLVAFSREQVTLDSMRNPAIVQGAIAGRKDNGYRRYGLSALGLAILAVLIIGAFIYSRSARHAGIAAAPSATTNRLYAQMNQAEQLQFVAEQEQRISAMLGDRLTKLNDEALRAIKFHIDRGVARAASQSDKPGAESLNVIYARAVPLVPMIARAFAARKIPIIVGIYLPIIESGYRPCFENSIGAKGLFQFLPSTAKQYGVAPGEMCDAEKMAPAAAHYIADGMAELGDDSQSMTLVLLSYNSGPDPVRNALRRLRETDANYERNFWTLYANRDKLDDGFRNESAGYVPAFFAAAIIGENPRNFDLQTPALSTLAKDSTVQR